jgi:hypothetical protein
MSMFHSRFAAMRLPMVPRPINPIFIGPPGEFGDEFDFREVGLSKLKCGSSSHIVYLLPPARSDDRANSLTLAEGEYRLP